MSEQLPVLDDTRVRGVQNPRVIDLIQVDVQTENLAELVMFEERQWEEGQERREELSEKFNNYLEYVLEGFFYEQYPQYEGFRVNFVFECQADSTTQYEAILAPMQNFAASQSIGFLVRPFSASPTEHPHEQ